MFKEIKKQSLYEMQLEILDFWQKNRIFEKSVETRSADNTYSFYDGPPFITGSPHYGTLLPSVAKDIIPRYQTMKGKRVRRVWGWDCHGLPAENKVEKQLGLKSKKDIEILGVGTFVAACRDYVTTVSADWKWYIDHIGRWADMEHAYKTMNLSYMETVIWAFKELYDKGLIYKGLRSSLYCTHCATPLSKFEITMDDGFYRDVTDPSVTVKFRIKTTNDVPAYFLAWTTTPWTLPGNAALAVDAKEVYVEVVVGGEKYILAKKTLTHIEELSPKVLRELKGSELVGSFYEPLYTFLQAGPNDYRVYAADFVTMDDGTGIVHVAPAFGEVDFELGRKEGLSLFMTVDEEGKFIKDVFPWAGLYIKKADPLIAEELKTRKLLLKSVPITHSYPFCYRCENLLIFKAQDAWYLNVEKLRARMLETNEKINWVPEHFKVGRFAHNLRSAPDWCLSRSRYFASPIPVWECLDCGESQVFGSLKALEDSSGVKITDLHRPIIDEVLIPCSKCGKPMHRVREVLDCWFESGAMPYGERHYPFENQEEFERGFPADFIIEYTGQLRGWFYYLHVLGVGLRDSHVFKNVIVSGNLKGNDGRKMSKSLGNYPDPKDTLMKYGGETLRLYFMSNPIMTGEDMSVTEEDIAEFYKKVMTILWNSYQYFVTYANLHAFQPAIAHSLSTHKLDQWILARLEEMADSLEDGFESYDYPRAVRAVRPFIEDLSTWYIRRSRERFVQGDIQALNTLYMVLMRFVLAIAPVLPFSAESMYQGLAPGGLLKDFESVHLCYWEKADRDIIKSSETLFLAMSEARIVSSLGNAIRKEINIPIRQPLQKLELYGAKNLDGNEELIKLVKEELNVKELVVVADKEAMSYKTRESDGVSVSLDTRLTPELMHEGLLREVMRAIQEFRKSQGLSVGAKAQAYYATHDEEVKGVIQEAVKNIGLASKLVLIESDIAEDGASLLNGRLIMKLIK